MAAETALRIATVAVLGVLLASVVAALRLRRSSGEVRLGVLQHVEELRRRLLVVAAALVAGLVLALTTRLWGWHVAFGGIAWVVPLPVPEFYDTVSAQLFRAAAAHLVPPGVELIVTSPMDGFAAQFNVALGIAITLALPVALYQLGRFLAPALRPPERRMLAWGLVPATLLFLLGALFAYVVVLPFTLATLYQFSGALGARGLLSVQDFASFTLGFLVGFGLAFQTPLVMAALSRAGLVAPRAYWGKARHAIVVILIVAMVVTPDPTIVSQLMLAVPMVLLYVLGAFAAAWVAPKGQDGTGLAASRPPRRIP
ncbi:MAG TPA: twin-arginine translocase subunit TatC [Candidatus Thermoplasmatota archaeon]|nr:twin-arginine translocase subunit TatC [Candidatus Thermoplasmatota archaeon]